MKLYRFPRKMTTRSGSLHGGPGETDLEQILWNLTAGTADTTPMNEAGFGALFE